MLTFIVTVVSYFALVWVALPLLVPNLLPTKRISIPKDVPTDIEKVIDEIKSNGYSKNQALVTAYDFVTSKYQGDRLKTFTSSSRMPRPFATWMNGQRNCNGGAVSSASKNTLVPPA